MFKRFIIRILWQVAQNFFFSTANLKLFTIWWNLWLPTDHARHRCDLFRTGNCKLL
jgi:hypothetical protein